MSSHKRLAVAGVFALAAAGCASGTADLAANPSAPDGLRRFYDQKPEWSPCAAGSSGDAESPEDPKAGFECTKIKVPLDYSKPDGETIELAVNRLPAADRAKRIGSLLTNPGGPGGSGLDFAYEARDFFTQRIRDRYDVVGMDPRGVGESSPVVCEITKRMADVAERSKDPEAASKLFVDGCESTSGKLLDEVGTDNTARDLDVVRGVLGDPKLNYMGISYGTVLGQFYADMFPSHVGRMVLDSVANPNGWPADPTAQAQGFETGFQVLVQTCVARPDCPMGTTRREVMDKFGDLIDRLKKSPEPAKGDIPPVTADETLGVLSQASYSEATWPSVEQALALAFKGDGTGIRAMSGAGSGSGSAGTESAGSESPGGEADESVEADGSFQAIMCRHIPPDERTPQAAEEGGKEAITVAPFFGEFVRSTLMNCANWPAPSLPNAGRAIRADGAPTILLVANTNDAATPVAWARGVNGQLADSVLVTNTSGGHGFYPMGACTHEVVDDFLLEDRIPGVRTCHDRNPALVPSPTAEPTP
jgi:pimeloyl-ACP methyl ester carboxylesterase